MQMLADKVSLKLFIASSKEVKTERDRTIFILYLLNKAFPHLHLEPVMWEYDLPSISHPEFASMQEAINVKLAECKLAAFIFYSKLGPFTKVEFDLIAEKKIPSFLFFRKPLSDLITSDSSYQQLLNFRNTIENYTPIDYDSLLEYEYEFYKNLNLYLAQKYGREPELMLTIEQLQETLRQQEKAKTELENQLSSQITNDKLKAQALDEMKNGKYEAAENLLLQSAENLIDKTASTYMELGAINELQLLYQKAYDYYELATKIQPDNSFYLNAAGVIANCQLGLYDSAENYFKRALALQRERKEVNKIPQSMHNLAQAYEYKGNYQEALEYSKQVIDFIKKHKIEETPDTSVYYNLLANIYVHLNQPDNAIQCFKVALENANKFYSKEPYHMALIQNSLGILYYQIGDYSKAIQSYDNAVSITTKLYGEKNINVKIQYTNLAMSYESLNQTDLAIEYLAKALRAAKQLYPNENQNYIHIYKNYGSVYITLHNWDKAIEYLDKECELIKKFLGEVHPDLVVTYVNLGIAWGYKANNEKALENFNSGLSVAERLENNFLIAILNFKIASTYQAIQQYNLAIENYKKALTIWKEDSESKPSKVVDCYVEIGICFYKLKAIDKAIEQLLNAINSKQGTEQDNVIMIQCYYHLAVCFYDEKQYLKAIEYYQKALNYKLKLDKKETGEIGVYYNSIGNAWYKLKIKDKAIDNYLFALPILKKFYPAGHSNIEICEKNLEKATQLDFNNDLSNT